MTLQDLKEAMKTALKNKETVKLSVVRGLIAACTNELVAKGRGPEGQLSDEEILSVVMRAAKQRKDSIEQFEKGGRPELAAGEKDELAILETMLPAQMSVDEIEAAVKAKATELGLLDPDATVGAGKSGANKLMGMLMKDLKGKADGTLVKAAVDKLFVA